MADLQTDFSAFLLGGVNSGSGKTTISLALMRAFRRRGWKVAPFKCGPDYIDPTFHRCATGGESVNLECRMMGAEAVRQSFARRAADSRVAVVEGVMGLFDGVSADSLSGSSAEIALTLGIPVVLVVNARGMAGSIAPLVAGFAHWKKDLKIIGVIADNAGGANHVRLLEESLKNHGLPPLLGALPRNPEWTLPERHLGLVPELENGRLDAWFDQLGEAAEKFFHLDLLLDLASMQRPLALSRTAEKKTARLAIARDPAFHFYYHDNLRMLEEKGIELVEFSPLNDSALPANIQGIYLGGGFPEQFARQLSENQAMRSAIGAFAKRGGILYAECGGYMYLMRSITDFEGRCWDMCGVVPSDAVMCPKLKSLGYRSVRLKSDCILGRTGAILKGHEFHYSEAAPTENPLWEAWNSRGERVPSGDGFCAGNVCGSYIHLHWASTPQAVESFTGALKKCMQ